MKEWSYLYLITVSKSFFFPPPQNSNFKLHVKLLIWIIPTDIKYLQRWLFQYSGILPRTFNTHENPMSIINSLLQWNSLKTVYSEFPITLLEFNELCTTYGYLKFTMTNILTSFCFSYVCHISINGKVILKCFLQIVSFLQIVFYTFSA